MQVQIINTLNGKVKQEKSLDGPARAFMATKFAVDGLARSFVGGPSVV